MGCNSPADCSLVTGVSVTLDYELVAGAFGGAILIYWVAQGTGGTMDYVLVKPSDHFLNQLGIVQRGEFYVDRPAGFVAGSGGASITVSYQPANLSAAGDGANYNKTRIHYFDWKPVYKNASTALVQKAVKTTDGLFSAAFVMRAKAGAAAGSVEIVAASDPVGGAASKVLLTGTEIGFDGMSVFTGPLKSSNFVTGSTGWQIDEVGTAEFNNLINRAAVQDGAVSNGGVYAAVATPTTFNDATYTPSINFGPMLLTESWSFGMTISVINWGTVSSYDSKSATYTYPLFFTIAYPEYRIKQAGVWGAWVSGGAAVQSNSHTVYNTGTASFNLLGKYDDLEMRYHITTFSNQVDPAATARVNLNVNDVNFIGRALIK